MCLMKQVTKKSQVTPSQPQRKSSPQSNRELTGGWTTASHAHTKTDDSASIFDEIGRF
jgi:hypothetical protein